MHKTRLLVALRKMPPRDLTWFRKFLATDFFCKHADSRRLADLLLAHAPSFQSVELEKRLVFKTLFGEAASYNELKINNLNSDLLNLLLQFLAFCQYEKHPSQAHFDQLDALLELELDGQFEVAARRAFHEISESKTRSAGYWRAMGGYFERLDRQFIQHARREFDDNLQQQNDALDLAFLLDKFRLACGMLSRNLVVNGQYEPHFLDDVKRWLAARPDWQTEPVVQVYEAAISLLENLQAADYQRFKAILPAAADCLPPGELFALYNYALNFCIRQINAGRGDWYAEALDLYRELLRRGVLFRNGHLSPWTYKNIVTTGLRTRDLEWTASFIQDFREKLPPDERENAHAFSLAALFYEQKNFAAALSALQTVEFTDAGYALGAKIIQLKSWFALGEEEALVSLINSTRIWLKRQSKMPVYGKRANLNFLRLLRPIFQVKMGRDSLLPTAEIQKRLKFLRKKMAQTEPLANKDWLAELIESHP